jgi:hypothetical protein
MSWHQEIMNVFISVLTRPKFKITLVSQDSNARGMTSSAVIKLDDGSIFELKINETMHKIYINCQSQFFVAPCVRNPQPMSPCTFNVKFNKDAPGKVKKLALVLAKKLSLKPVFDVMKA